MTTGLIKIRGGGPNEELLDGLGRVVLGSDGDYCGCKYVEIRDCCTGTLQDIWVERTGNVGKVWKIAGVCVHVPIDGPTCADPLNIVEVPTDPALLYADCLACTTCDCGANLGTTYTVVGDPFTVSDTVTFGVQNVGPYPGGAGTPVGTVWDGTFSGDGIFYPFPAFPVTYYWASAAGLGDWQGQAVQGGNISYYCYSLTWTLEIDSFLPAVNSTGPTFWDKAGGDGPQGVYTARRAGTVPQTYTVV